MSYRITFTDRPDVLVFATIEAAQAEYLERVKSGQHAYLRDTDGRVLSAFHDLPLDLEDPGSDAMQAWPTEDDDMLRARGVEP